MKIIHSFFVVFALALASLFLFTAPLNAQAKEQNRMPIVIVAPDAAGVVALEQLIAAKMSAVVIVTREIASAAVKPDSPPIIADPHGLLAMRMLQPDISPPLPDAQEIIAYQQTRTGYAAPPNLGYRGISFSNPTRASPSMV